MQCISAVDILFQITVEYVLPKGAKVQLWGTQLTRRSRTKSDEIVTFINSCTVLHMKYVWQSVQNIEGEYVNR